MARKGLEKGLSWKALPLKALSRGAILRKTASATLGSRQHRQHDHHYRSWWSLRGVAFLPDHRLHVVSGQRRHFWFISFVAERRWERVVKGLTIETTAPLPTKSKNIAPRQWFASASIVTTLQKICLRVKDSHQCSQKENPGTKRCRFLKDGQRFWEQKCRRTRLTI